MNIEEFLSRISFRYDTWDDYGYKQTAEFIFNGDSEEKSYFVKIHPNTDENFRRIQENRIEEEGKYFLFGQSKEYYQFISDTLEDEGLNRWFTLTGDIVYKGNDFIAEYNELRNEYQKAIVDDELDNNFDYEDNPENLIGMFGSSFFRDQSLSEWKESLNNLHRLTVNESFLSDYKFTIKKSDQTVFEVDVKPKDNISVRLSDKSLPIIIKSYIQ